MRGLKKKLAEQNVLGTFVSIPGVENAEILATAGFDWLIFDLEHSMIELKDLQAMIAVVENKDVASVVRIPRTDSDICKKVLDAGCQGIMFPMVGNARQAQQAVQAVKYPPKGFRGVGIGRAHDYGARFQEYVQEANSKTCVILQIENSQGLDNLEDIAAVADIDVIFIGTADLQRSLGLKHVHELEEHIQRIKTCCQHNGLIAGIIEFDPAKAKGRFDEGFGFVAFGVDCLFYLNAAKSIVTDTLNGVQGS